ncbi:hypothetical protein NDU88_008882 [Pleurodeles waltl]|uniref:Uncharacterized protein n=1 Tax=Pleurodeles waltl TaxID=8319 RepID=A0AAV7NXV6_PLEWA|nr:hypothetical protein NDU88_008882 [Pleurodeles waltl]
MSRCPAHLTCCHSSGAGARAVTGPGAPREIFYKGALSSPEDAGGTPARALAGAEPGDEGRSPTQCIEPGSGTRIGGQEPCPVPRAWQRDQEREQESWHLLPGSGTRRGGQEPCTVPRAESLAAGPGALAPPARQRGEERRAEVLAPPARQLWPVSFAGAVPGEEGRSPAQCPEPGSGTRSESRSPGTSCQAAGPGEEDRSPAQCREPRVWQRDQESWHLLPGSSAQCPSQERYQERRAGALPSAQSLAAQGSFQGAAPPGTSESRERRTQQERASAPGHRRAEAAAAFAFPAAPAPPS